MNKTPKKYRTKFSIRLVDRGVHTDGPVVVKCTDEDYFFYMLLTSGVKRGIISDLEAAFAEPCFFFNGYNWADRPEETV